MQNKEVKMKRKNLTVTLLLVLGVFGLVGTASLYGLSNNSNDNLVPLSGSDASPSQTEIAESKDEQVLPKSSTEEQLLYLIEEEKLAHDVYTVMYQKYGANVFGNILQSESTHQDRVLALLQARDIADPRSDEVGIFKNQELQKLYNDLIEQGSKSAAEAYKVGVVIEEKDIADISMQLATATEQDIIPSLESLRNASENHLRAFNKQL